MLSFNRHFRLEGKHAFLSASKYHWIRYDDEKLDETFRTSMDAAKGSRLHDLAKELITMGVRLPTSRKTINLYVNDAIGYRMTPEQPLYYSDNAFGTADAISFRKGLLRIHDLKTGVTKASFDQLMIYVAFFCFEYDIRPHEIKIELRIYQNDEVQIYVPELDEIIHIMDKIKTFDRRIEELKAAALD